MPIIKAGITVVRQRSGVPATGREVEDAEDARWQGPPSPPPSPFPVQGSRIAWLPCTAIPQTPQLVWNSNNTVEVGRRGERERTLRGAYSDLDSAAICYSHANIR